MIVVYGKRLISRTSFVIKSKSWTMKCSSYTIYLLKNLKCCTKTPCMTTETLSLTGNSLGHPSLDVRVDVRRLQWTAVSLSSRPTVKCKLTWNGTSHLSSHIGRKSFDINLQVSLYVVFGILNKSYMLNISQFLWRTKCLTLAVCRKRQS